MKHHIISNHIRQSRPIKTKPIGLDWRFTELLQNKMAQKKASSENAPAYQSNKAFKKPATVTNNLAEVEEIIKENICYPFRRKTHS